MALHLTARKIVGLGLALALGVLAGCAHYSTNPHSKLTFNSVYVAPISNRSFAPQAQALLSQQLIESLQMESDQVSVTTRNNADVTVEVVIIDYNRTISATQSRDTFLAQSYFVTMIAAVSLIDNRTGEVLMDGRRVSATVNTFVTPSGFVGVEYQTMPILTRELATKIKDSVISVW